MADPQTTLLAVDRRPRRRRGARPPRASAPATSWRSTSAAAASTRSSPSSSSSRAAASSSCCARWTRGSPSAPPSVREVVESGAALAASRLCDALDDDRALGSAIRRCRAASRSSRPTASRSGAVATRARQRRASTSSTASWSRPRRATASSTPPRSPGSRLRQVDADHRRRRGVPSLPELATEARPRSNDAARARSAAERRSAAPSRRGPGAARRA